MKYLRDVAYVFFQGFGVNKNVIKIYHYKDFQKIREDIVNQVLKRSGCVGVTGGPPGALRLDWGPERSGFQGLRYEERLTGYQGRSMTGSK